MSCLFALTAAATAAGCGSKLPKLAPVEGRVMLDGRPLPRGVVMFYPEVGRPAQGEIGLDGTFSLTTFTSGDGAMLGQHRATVDARQVTRQQMLAPIDDDYLPPVAATERLQWLAPATYASRETSPLKVVVKPGKNQIELELSSRPTESASTPSP